MKSELVKIVNSNWQELEDKRNSNNLEDISDDLIRYEIQKTILEEETLSKNIKFLEELEKFGELIYHNFMKEATISQKIRYSFGDIGNHVRDINLSIWHLLNNYGVLVGTKKDNHLVMNSEFGDIQQDEYFNETRILPDNPQILELVRKIFFVNDKKRELRKSQFDYVGDFDRYVMDGFDDWRAAVEFAKHNHTWTRKGSYFRKSSPFKIANMNAERYKKFKLTSAESINKIKPGNLYQVENVFGDFAIEYISGNFNKFQEMSNYAHLKDAKKIFKNDAKSNYALFKELIKK